MNTKNGLIVALVAIACSLSQEGLAFDSMHGAVPVPKLNYDSLNAAAVPLSESPDGQALIAACMERYGGADRLAALKRIRLTYRMKAFMNRDTVDVVKLFERDRHYRISKRNAAIDETRILSEKESWYVGRDTVMVLYGGRYNAELFSYLTLAMPLAITTERFDDIRFGTRDGDSLQYIYMSKNDTLMIVVGVDPGDHLIKSSEGIIRQGDSNFVFINHFSDYRGVAGYTFPHMLVNISMGLEVGRSWLTRVDVNPVISEDEFRPIPKTDPHNGY